ncbi:hypothetical protein [Mesonia sp.]|uniref:hypothetical protein n=1 Tax=Mesonia sp. TaxID=1960830 RepID=UPI001752B122|nr:hypothetical protein [Mesonia sp.]HIB37815.1 hypothetical protein [Mesonia sp.]HIO26466.1 hypothetical protein [Flavobacteriaceae bacterium]
MKKLITLFSITLLIACSQEEKKDPFLITKNDVGLLSKDIQVRELDSIFAKDSIISFDKNQIGNANQIAVYDNKGKELLLLNPVQRFDSTSTISTIQLKDKRFKTDKGLSTESTFKDITTHYKISRIENTLSNVIVFLDDINVYVAIDKKYISGDAKYNTDIPVEPNQIPDDAKIKRFWIGWE